MSEDLRIVFEEDGYPRELIDARDRERAVRSEALSPDTVVTVYRRGAMPVASKAGDVAELRSLFETSGQMSRPDPTPAAATPSPWSNVKDPPRRRDWGSGLSPLGEEPEEYATPVLYEQQPHGRLETPPRKRRGCLGIFGVLTILFVLILFVGMMAGDGGTSKAGEPARYVATGAANVRSGPTSDGTEVVDRLGAGDVVVARKHSASDGSGWLEILEGPNRGRYAWAGNFDAADEAAAGPR
jgi:hypothetical protein